MAKTGELFEKLVAIMTQLRTPERGCPWDLEQTHSSITPYMIEEAYEVIETIEAEDDQEFSKELGDLMLQVVFHAQMAKERQAFNIDQVLENICTKLIRRHPHVFGETNVNGSSEVLKNWEAIKQEERLEKTPEDTSMLAGVPRSMPALLRAQRLCEKSSRVNFDWPNVEGVLAKVDEELGELKSEIRSSEPLEQKKLKVEHELGDVLFTLCRLAGWNDLSAEGCLKVACDRFTARFRKMEELSDKHLRELSPEELETLWAKAKIGN